jgi:hypothetical protein
MGSKQNDFPEDLKGEIFKALGLPPQSEYSKKNDLKYSSADSIDELLIYYGEAVLVASASIIRRLKTPSPPGLFLRIMSILKKDYTDRFYYGYFNLVSLAIIFVVNEAKQYIKEQFKDILSEQDYQNIIFNSGVYFAELYGLPKNKIRESEFQNILFHYIDFYNLNPVDRSLDIFNKMKEFYEDHYLKNRKMDSKSFAKIAGMIVHKYHLSLLDTGTFIGNYKRLKKESENR